MKKYSVVKLLKTRWGWRDLRNWGIMSTVQTALHYLTATITLTNKTTGVVTVLTGLNKLGICAIMGMSFWTFIYLLGFLGGLAMCALMVYGANRDYPGYRQMYAENLANE
ncbi:hypothetical protein KIT04_096 [Vibrio phage KIT04]|nr:hypothetical protein KIT04_096 [Vibrio phage KIT04]